MNATATKYTCPECGATDEPMASPTSQQPDRATCRHCGFVSRLTGFTDVEEPALYRPAAAHTPGPWHLSDETSRDGLRSRLVHGMPEGMLAIVRVENQGRYYGDANARLIAASPELLAALKACVESLKLVAQEITKSPNGEFEAWSHQANSIRMANSAIAKASA